MNNNDNMTTLIDAMLYAMEGEDPSKAIENQERRGQQSVVKNQRLPKRQTEYAVPIEVRRNGADNSMGREEINKILTQNNIEYTRQQYEKMGIIIIDEYDDLFWNVTLPEGWKIKATDHNMWNDLFDNKGRKRATFFYKAAFYDRDAFINFNTRYTTNVDHIADARSDYEIWQKSDYQGIVEDGEKVIFKTITLKPTGNYIDDDRIKVRLQNELDKYMEENYPDYKNIHAYWD